MLHKNLASASTVEAEAAAARHRRQLERQRWFGGTIKKVLWGLLLAGVLAFFSDVLENDRLAAAAIVLAVLVAVFAIYKFVRWVLRTYQEAKRSWERRRGRAVRTPSGKHLPLDVSTAKGRSVAIRAMERWVSVMKGAGLAQADYEFLAQRQLHSASASLDSQGRASRFVSAASATDNPLAGWLFPAPVRIYEDGPRVVFDVELLPGLSYQAADDKSEELAQGFGVFACTVRQSADQRAKSQFSLALVLSDPLADVIVMPEISRPDELKGAPVALS